MNIKEICKYYLAKTGVPEGFPFGENVLVYKAMNRMVALTGLEEGPPYANLKCEPELAIELRDQHPEVTPAWHFNKII